MQKQMTDEQIARARELRREGMSYAEIKTAIGADIAHDSIRHHCADILAQGEKARTRMDKERTGKDGRVIRPFTDDEDAAIIAFVNGPPDGTIADLARQIDRKHHSVTARIRTLRKHGKLPPL